MTTRTPFLAIAAALVAVAGATAIGCGAGEITLSKGEVETQAKTSLGKVVGREPESVTCPGDMPAKVGQTMRCVLSDRGSRYGVTATITSVDTATKTAKFDVLVDKTPLAK